MSETIHSFTGPASSIWVWTRRATTHRATPAPSPIMPPRGPPRKNGGEDRRGSVRPSRSSIVPPRRSGIDQPRFPPRHLAGHGGEVRMHDALERELEEIPGWATCRDQLAEIFRVDRPVDPGPG